MTMIFDNGASWQFSIKLEEVSPSVKTDRLVAQTGKPPAQYGPEDEEGECGATRIAED